MTLCTAPFWRALSRRSVRRDNSTRCRQQCSLGQMRRDEGTALGPCCVFHWGRWRRVSLSVVNWASRVQSPRLQNAHISNLKPFPGLVFTCEQFSSMIPNNFSEWIEKHWFPHLNKKPLPERTWVPCVALAPQQKTHRDFSPQLQQVGALLPSSGAMIYIFSTVREGLSLTCFKWQFL